MLKNLVNQQIIQRLPYSDREVENNPFYRDFLVFLKYVEENTPKLTQAKNLQLKSLAEINESLIRKRPMEEKVGKYIFRVRSQNEMYYIQTIDALAQVLKLTRKSKGRLRIAREKKFFDSLPPRVKFNLIWRGYIHYLNWAYLQYLENSDKIAQTLQDNQEFLWLLLRNFDIEANESWISLNFTLETIRKNFKISWQTVMGDDFDLARWGIKLVLFKDLLETLDLVQTNETSKKFRFTDLGRKIIRLEVGEDEVGLSTENWPESRESEDFKMPKWMECTWRRVPCGRNDCRICDQIKKDRQEHIEKGEDPDDLKSVFEDVGQTFKEVLEMIKKDAAGKGIDITNTENIKEPPEPEEFSLYREVREWNRSVITLRETAQSLGEFWIYTEAADDLFWYANILTVKTYRQLCNQQHIQNGDESGEFDYQYTRWVLRESLKILKKSLEELIEANRFQKENLNLIWLNLQKLEKQIIQI